MPWWKLSSRQSSQSWFGELYSKQGPKLKSPLDNISTPSIIQKEDIHHWALRAQFSSRASLQAHSLKNHSLYLLRASPERVLNCLPVAFYSLDIFDRISEKMEAHETNKLKSAPDLAPVN